MKINLGQAVRDRITGFKGVAVCRDEWLNGCVRIGIQPRELVNGKPIETEYFDEAQLVPIGKPLSQIFRPTGGPKPSPKYYSKPK